MSKASNSEEASSSNKDDKQKLVRCMEWLQKQNKEDTEKLENKNDIQFIVQTHAARKNFLLAVAEHDATVPSGINEPSLEPRNVVSNTNLLKSLNPHHLQLFFYPFQSVCQKYSIN